MRYPAIAISDPRPMKDETENAVHFEGMTTASYSLRIRVLKTQS